MKLAFLLLLPAVFAQSQESNESPFFESIAGSGASLTGLPKYSKKVNIPGSQNTFADVKIEKTTKQDDPTPDVQAQPAIRVPANPALANSLQLGLAPIPVPGFPNEVQQGAKIPGVNTIPGLDTFNYLIGSLIPQAVAPANQLFGGSLSRILPNEQTTNLAGRLFDTLAAPSTNVEVPRMMGRWFQVINSPQVIREACTVAHYGALTNNSYSATFTILKFYREGTALGPPRFSLGYGFKAGNSGNFIVHNSNSPDAEPYWVVKVGPLNEFNQYDYAIISNWVRFPVLVLARDPERFERLHMRKVLQYLEDNRYINVMTKALNMIAPVDYSQCQYTPTFASAG